MSVEGTTPGPILVGVDGSEGSVRALCYAAGLAARSGQALIAVHVRRFPQAATLTVVDEDVVALVEATEGLVREQVQEALAGTQARWRMVVREGDPATELHQEAVRRRASMLVISTRGAGVGARFHRLSEGSVSGWLLRHEATPLLVVR